MRCFYSALLVFVIVSGLLFPGCSSREFTLEWALCQAGDNRPELEKVLRHYSLDAADSLKYRAAEYLIVNMPGHFSFDSVVVNAFCDRADSIMALPIDSSFLELARVDPNEARNNDWKAFKVPALEKISEEMPFSRESMKEDIQVLTAEYLIRNIDAAFESWTSPWAAHLDFEDFCEFLLPYKIGDPFLPDDWREYCRGFCDSIRNLNDMQYCQYYKNSVHWATHFVNAALCQHLRIIGPYDYSGNPLLRMSTFMKKHFVSCDEKGSVCVAVMRSQGIPVAIEYTPQWPTIYPGHSWCTALVNSNGYYEKFEVLEGTPGETQRPGEVMAKVYRRSYAINPALYRINHSGESVPPHLRNVFIRDVTSNYMSTQTVDMEIPSRKERGGDFVYLAMFGNGEWTPVAYGEVRRKKAFFENVGRSTAYLPVCYAEDRSQPFGYPFTIDASGRVEYLKPDTTCMQTLSLSRKYPSHYHVYNTAKRLQGGKFQGANRPDFKDSVTVYEFKGWNNPSGEILSDNDTLKFRYWRFLSPPEHYNQMAEAMFYAAGDTIPNNGRIIGTRGSRTGEKEAGKEAMFDKDPFTFFDAYRPSGDWAGIDFGKPVAMDRFLYVYRSDDNNIRIGDVYELFYWKDNNGWASLGKKEADDIKLIYDQVPSHALYLLRDITRGKEERIFTIKEGAQVWW